jgi:hypothetical protein
MLLEAQRHPENIQSARTLAGWSARFATLDKLAGYGDWTNQQSFNELILVFKMKQLRMI